MQALHLVDKKVNFFGCNSSLILSENANISNKDFTKCTLVDFLKVYQSLHTLNGPKTVLIMALFSKNTGLWSEQIQTLDTNDGYIYRIYRRVQYFTHPISKALRFSNVIQYSLELSPRNIREDFFLKIGILRAKVYTKTSPT